MCLFRWQISCATPVCLDSSLTLFPDTGFPRAAYRAEGKQENTILLVIAGGTEAELNLSDYAVASTV